MTSACDLDFFPEAQGLLNLMDNQKYWSIVSVDLTGTENKMNKTLMCNALLLDTNIWALSPWIRIQQFPEVWKSSSETNWSFWRLKTYLSILPGLPREASHGFQSFPGRTTDIPEHRRASRTTRASPAVCGPGHLNFNLLLIN